MAGIARMGSVVLDTPDPKGLAQFYARLLGWEPDPTDTSDDWATIRDPDGGGTLMFQKAPDLRTPHWPDPDRPQQFHIDVEVDDIPAAEKQVLELGATTLDHQPGGDSFRVFADPSGHPFCLCRS